MMVGSPKNQSGPIFLIVTLYDDEKQLLITDERGKSTVMAFETPETVLTLHKFGE